MQQSSADSINGKWVAEVDSNVWDAGRRTSSYHIRRVMIFGSLLNVGSLVWSTSMTAISPASTFFCDTLFTTDMTCSTLVCQVLSQTNNGRTPNSRLVCGNPNTGTGKESLTVT